MSEAQAIGTHPNVSGFVMQVTDRGLQLSGYEQWFYVSKFLRVPVTMPALGDHVTLRLSPTGWILAITPNADAERLTAKKVALSQVDRQLGNPDAMLRLRCLGHALQLVQQGSSEYPTAEAVFNLAEKIERWARGGAA